MKKSLKILMVGPQASGKGTQAKILSEKLSLPIFSTGNILRQKIQEGDELGRKLAEVINSGRLVSDNLVNEIIAEKIKRDGGQATPTATQLGGWGYILDGYPRNLAQANFLDSKDQLTHVFEIYITDEEAVRRISGRRTCPQCQTVYHIEYNPPKEKGRCDKCGVELIVRDDEKPDIVKERLKNYHELTEPVIDFYKEKGVHIKINGMVAIKEVAREINEKLVIGY